MTVTLEQSCINALQRAAEEVGRSPTVDEYRDLNITPSATTIQRVCGSWNEAKEQAGLVRYYSPQNSPQRDQEYGYDDCVEAVLTVDSRHPYQHLTSGIYDEYRDQSHPVSTVVNKHLGGFPEIRETIL